MNEFKDQLDASEKEKVSKLVAELRELAVKGQAADPAITAEIIKEKIDATQQASLGLFQKVQPFPEIYFPWDNAQLSTFHRSTRRETPRTTPRRLPNLLRAPRATRRRKIKVFHSSIASTPLFRPYVVAGFIIDSLHYPSHISRTRL